MQPNENNEFIVEQYSQYWQMLRWHISSSWNIPALSLVVVFGILGFSVDKIDKIHGNYLILSISCLLLSAFLFVMMVHHSRNLLWVKHFEEALKSLEGKYGDLHNVYHSQISPTLDGFKKISSSKLLGFFLGLCSAVFFIAGICMLFLYI